MIIHIVMWKLKTQPSVAASDPPTTFTDATATGVIQATQEQIAEYQANAMKEISTALSKVPGPMVPMQFGPPQLPERAKGYNFALYSKFKDRAALHEYDISEAHKTTVANIVKPHVEDVMAYDFELPDDA
ncbi:Dabb domain-containing protein [Ceratobasidium sp. AG-Ba]|nr:Dabb domain-containing protein [Ceratobasidium sp. AG-Ba]QRV89585.1 Dabb domain-containing protein [Ceratobasidium sp. AG-Ba]QRW03795.1 Dabb domain-containing protein [Ceratobasidium sp. AG-Ba]